MFFELDFVSIILAIVTILLAWQFLDKLLVWFWEKTGIEFRHIRKRREEHELLVKTAENLSKLQEQHQEDVERVTQNDRKMQQEFSEFVEELKSALTAQREQMDIYAKNRINDREKSREIQRDFNESQKKFLNQYKDLIRESAKNYYDTMFKSINPDINIKYEFK